MKILLPVLLFFFLSFSLQAQQKSPSLPSNGFMITPLMGLIDDQIPTLYYKRYFVNDSSSYFNFRIGSEFLSKMKHEFSTGSEFHSSRANWKLGFEYGIYREKSSLYFGVEVGHTVIRSSGGYLIPLEGSIFKSNRYRAVETNHSHRNRMRMVSLQAFIGFRYHLNQHFSLGAEAALGRGWFLSEIKYDRDRQVADEKHNGRINDFIPLRFISLQYSF